jgi:hypothetical protein
LVHGDQLDLQAFLRLLLPLGKDDARTSATINSIAIPFIDSRTPSYETPSYHHPRAEIASPSFFCQLHRLAPLGPHVAAEDTTTTTIKPD